MKQEKAYTKVNSFVGIAPLVLFLSSYAPLFLLIALKQILSNNERGYKSLDSIWDFTLQYGMSVICIMLALIGLIGTYYTFRNINHKIENGVIVEVKEISSLNDEPLAYIATYIVPLMFEDYTKLSNNITIMIIFYVIYRLYIHSKLILVNPLLGLKFSIFNIKYQDGNIVRQGILISKDNYIEESDYVKIYNVGYQLFYGKKR